MSDWVDTAQGIASTLAILVGGFWAYFKFIRGRTFARRAELSVTASVVRSRPAKIMQVALTVRNTGASKIDFAEGLSVLYVYAAIASDVRPQKNVDWGEHLIVARILADHGWIEAQEVITEEFLIPLQADDTSEERATLAYRIVCKAIAKRVRWRRDLKWTASAIILPS